MPWWDDIWLNEGFATWLQTKIAHGWDPQYHFDRDTQLGALRAMRVDSLVSTRQVRRLMKRVSVEGPVGIKPKPKALND